MTKYLIPFLLLWVLCGLTAQNPARLGKDHAIFFYVADYQNGWERLPETKEEAEAIAAELKNQYGFTVEIVSNPSKALIESKITEANQRRYDAGDQLLLFFSMHGHYDKEAERGYLIPADGKLQRQDANAWKSWLSYDDLSAYLSRNPCPHILLALDACYSGAFGDRWKGGPEAFPWDEADGDCSQRIARALAPTSRLYFTSGSKEQRTPAKSKFANRWLEALVRGRSAGIVHTRDIRYYLSSIEYPEPEGGTFTKRNKPGGDFIFVHKNACGGSLPTDRAADKAAWQAAEKTNTLEAYRRYVRDFPNGEFRPLADRRITAFEAELQEELAWENAKKINTLKSYEDFIRDYPNSVYKSLAEYNRDQLRSSVPTAPSAPSNFVFVQGGSFKMGNRTVTLGDYYMSRYELTFDEYDAYCAATGKTKPGDEGWGRGKRPVINVSWLDAVAYCNWRSEKDGREKVYTISGDKVSADWSANGYRLPTEAEWEFAARSRGRDETWAGTSKESELALYANFCDKNCSNSWKDDKQNDGYANTATVGYFRANALGLYDMSGNVWEWCWDWCESLPASAETNPRGPSSGSARVLRGGSWIDNAGYCRVALREDSNPGHRNGSDGFRLVFVP